jgi:anaerobic selenocysteine-containing dehydrogenase/Fe-S-cluster-containing dehydrogenase component
MPDGSGIERRDFLKVLGVAGAGASLFGCSSAAPEKLIPYVIGPEDIVPGLSTWYRTTCRECPAGCGMNVRTREGRAIKAEGNPLSPISHGKLCSRGQASLHGLYDPDRIPQALARNAAGGWDKLTWDAAERKLAAALGQARGHSVFLTPNFTGTLDSLIDEFCVSLGITRVRHEAFGYEPIRAANRMLFGVDAVPVHDFKAADVVATFGADFMETWVSPIDYSHGFVQSHAYTSGKRGYLIAVSPHQSLTDMNADDWLPIKPGTEHLVALAMAQVIAQSGRGQAGVAASLLGGIELNAVASQSGVSAERIRHAAMAFGNGGKSLAVGPGIGSTHAAATAVAAAVAVLNSVAGNYGKTVTLSPSEAHTRGLATHRDMQTLMRNMAAGQVSAVLVHGPNPVYTMPERDNAAAAFAKVPFVASFSSFLDETSARAHLLLPDNHFLESWGDYVAREGVYAVTQPVMTPVFSTKQTGDVLIATARLANAKLSSTATTYYDYLRERWSKTLHPQAGAGATFDDWWRNVLETGVVVVTNTAVAPAGSPLNASGLGQLSLDVPQFSGSGEYTLVVYPSLRFMDGRLANRPWLQELPDPISKLTWMSCIEINPETATKLGLDDGHMVEVTTQFGKVTLPVWRHPGTRPEVIALQLGQGHTELGRYAKGGVNAVKLLGDAVDPVSGALCYTQVKAALKPTGEWYRMAQAGTMKTQGGREIALTTTLVKARSVDPGPGVVAAAGPTGRTRSEQQGMNEPASEQEEEGNPLHKMISELQAAGGFLPDTMGAGPAAFPPPDTYYGEYTEKQPRWALSIDMERCIGCSACMTACYSENNIGIVGPELVAEGRILTWMRIERYFEEEHEKKGTVRFLPVMCQQCGNAPCEPVCPVYAAYHTPEGLNAQIYNRCVGTRYCANNCSYKVRYFNWYTYEWPEPLNWQLNPDVTVREKGVMEKCTFCVQRIRDAQNNARLEDRGVMDGEITTACAQTCPGDAIVFGNIKDPNSRVARVAASGRGYRVLEELNTQPGVMYLKKVLVEGSEA